jgi:hypothetical protein
LKRNRQEKDNLHNGNAIEQASGAHECDVRLDATQANKVIGDMHTGIAGYQ